MQELGKSQYNYRIFMAQPNIIQFLEMLDDIPYDEEDIYRI
jgi:hypothetical protein